MTPKEKAEELFDKFRVKVHDRNGTSAMNGFEAKQCALIAVNEILKEYVHAENHIEDIMGKISIYIKYWQEVKQEIEAL
jgi:hypothetical protein